MFRVRVRVGMVVYGILFGGVHPVFPTTTTTTATILTNNPLSLLFRSGLLHLYRNVNGSNERFLVAVISPCLCGHAFMSKLLLQHVWDEHQTAGSRTRGKADDDDDDDD